MSAHQVMLAFWLALAGLALVVTGWFTFPALTIAGGACGAWAAALALASPNDGPEGARAFAITLGTLAVGLTILTVIIWLVAAASIGTH